MERQGTDMVPLGRDGFFKDPFFSSTWEEFDQDRNQIMKKSGNGFWDKVESDMADFEASVAAMEADMNQRMAPFKPGVPSWALPQNQHKNWSITNEMDNSLPSTSSSMICKDEVNTNKDKWEISIDVSNFSPDNLKVKVTGDVVVVSGSQVQIFTKSQALMGNILIHHRRAAIQVMTTVPAQVNLSADPIHCHLDVILTL